MLALVAALSLAIGVVLGMLGGGGAILTMPMLVYAASLDTKPAIATSLFVVGTTSAVATGVHARARNVEWRVGGLFGAAAMVGAFFGARLAQFIPGAVLLLAFAIVMLVTATAMLKGRRAATAGAHRLAVDRTLVLGASVGLLSGLVGAGGGFLIVPALTIFGGLAVPRAIGTSLFVIALQSSAGLAGHLAHVELDWTLALVVSGAAVLGSLGGASLGRKVSPDRLRQAFAWLVIGMGLFVFAKELPPIAAALASAMALGAIFLATRRSPELRTHGANEGR